MPHVVRLNCVGQVLKDALTLGPNTLRLFGKGVLYSRDPSAFRSLGLLIILPLFLKGNTYGPGQITFPYFLLCFAQKQYISSCGNT